MPEKALPHANRLGKITPGLSHMVHMPSHIYIRTGNYTKGVEVNKVAVEQYKKYLQLYPDVANNAPLYDFHNRHMEATCAMNGSNYGEALRSAIDCRNSFDTSFLAWEAPLGGYIQFVYMTPVFTMITFKKWNDILKLEAVEQRHHYAALLDEFAKGLAYANTKRLPEAQESLKRMDDLINQPDLEVPFGPFNSPKAGATIAKHLLIATIAEKEGRTNDAIHHYSKAVRIEDAMIYNEPKDWILPARHFLANALLRARKYTEAEKVFRQDLKYNPNNVTSKSGLIAVKNKRSNK